MYLLASILIHSLGVYNFVITAHYKRQCNWPNTIRLPIRSKRETKAIIKPIDYSAVYKCAIIEISTYLNYIYVRTCPSFRTLYERCYHAIRAPYKQITNNNVKRNTPNHFHFFETLKYTAKDHLGRNEIDEIFIIPVWTMKMWCVWCAS